MVMLISTATLIVAAIVSGIVCGLIPRVSGNYVSIIVGVVIALLPLNQLIAQFHSEAFMYIIAPLIYFEGQTTRIHFVGHWLRQIVETAVLLVVASMVVAGFSVYWCGIPLALSFVMAAISTPTDATATAMVSEGRLMPDRQDKLLRVESLFNDASGIVLVEAMALWLRAGHFEYQEALVNFLLSAGGGILVGVAFGVVMISFRRGMRGVSHSTYNAQDMLYLITPFFIYFAAEELHVSGIIAVVCAGLMQNSEGSRSRFAHPRQFHNGLVLIDLVREILNNMIFVVLGVLIVRIIRGNFATAHHQLDWLLAGTVLYLAMLAVRFCYGLLVKMSAKGSLIYALGGVHGGVTLALVFSISSSLSDQQFQFVVLAETLVVLLSMLVPTTAFHFILKADIPESVIQQRINKLRREMVIEGIRAVNKMYLPDNVRSSVLYDLRDQKGVTTLRDFWKQWTVTSWNGDFTRQEQDLERQALIWAFQAERQYLTMVAQREELRKYVFELYNEVVLAESILIDPQTNEN